MSNSMLFSVPHENNGPLSKCKLFIDSHGIVKKKPLTDFNYTGCPIKNGTVDFQYIASGKLSIFLRHRIKYFPQKRMTPKSLNLMK